MIARTLKNILRLYFRQLLKIVQIVTPQLQYCFIVDLLNKLSGFDKQSDEFWFEEIYLGIRFRFGECSVSPIERLNLRLLNINNLPIIIEKLQHMIGFKINWETMQKFRKNSRYFHFTIQDLESG